MKRLRRYPTLFLTLWLAAVLSSPAVAGTCDVPDSSYPTIQSAVDDPACTDLVLAAQAFPESVRVPRTLAITGAGASTVVAGFLRAHGNDTVVTVSDLKVEASCARGSLQSWTGGEIFAENVEAVSSTTFDCPGDPIFADGFESGDTSAWSTTVP